MRGMICEKNNPIENGQPAGRLYHVGTVVDDEQRVRSLENLHVEYAGGRTKYGILFIFRLG